MQSSGNFISTPTPRSVGLLTQVLSIYPTLRPILSSSHRADIIHLARTCRTLNSILRDSVFPLCTPFPRCTSALEYCHWCRAIVCISCKVQVQQQYKPCVMDTSYSDLTINAAMVFSSQTQTQTNLDVIHQVLIYQEDRNYHRGIQLIENTTLCASCFSTYGGPMPSQRRTHTQRYFIKELDWEELPITHTMCNCTPNTQAECKGDKRLMEFKDIPLESVLIAVVKLPQDLRETSTSEFVALYITGS
ncbi:hypothetical protein L211DRAFT_847066 [Terfezia boudieri ATCC MYA-4762]|uniref:F-box domain-containing protein n=1 Tax=Terfezia boudieri ATCC MYA-4762 TaxID=1051890 RepID=A0A3N4LU45_9PEZI|nr:hypothetical protein L211DRAFT_847066 [Terfezia boudieri ATCC MYA-4762]